VKRGIGLLAVSLAALAIAAPSFAQDVTGEWQFKRRAREGWHTGKLVIDGDGLVRQRGRSPMQDYAQCGRVVAPGSGKIEIVFTSVKTGRGYSLDHFYCTVQNEGALSCFNIDGIGKEDDLFVLERTRHTPASPDGQMDGICPARERPQV
jgi:hypothetical protein